METIHIQTESKNYDVFVGERVLSELPMFLSRQLPDLTRVYIITDETINRLHLNKLLPLLNKWNPVVFTAPSGEKAKTFEVYYQALSAALENGLDRKSVILAFGGGAVGDLSGFVAATFMRGISFIQIPTTILAHDSAVGGKTAINHPQGKNMIGAFYQPEAVFYDLSLLKTLPDKEVRSGFAEVIKHSLIADLPFYQWLFENVRSFHGLTTDNLTKSIVKGIKVKNEFVSQDEKEAGVRAYLNFGHTLGHAIEAKMGYGKMTHGECVMIGMLFALNLSKELLGLSFDGGKFTQWIQLLGYDIRIPGHLTAAELLEAMKHDKKTIGESIRFVLLEQIGQPTLMELSDSFILEQLNNFLKKQGEFS